MAINTTAYQALLLGAQAAGLAANIYGKRQERKLADIGIELERQEIGLRKSQEELAFSESNLASLRNLQEVLATQRAVMGARGQNPSQGSARAISQKSIQAHSSEERARSLSKNFRLAQFDSMNSLLNIKKSSTRLEHGVNLLEHGLNSFNLNTTIGEFINNGKNKLKTTNINETKQLPGSTKGPITATYKVKRGRNG